MCEKINSLKNYYTTSSCSGRIVLMVDQDKKESDLFIKIYHDLITFKQLKKDLIKIASLCSDIKEKSLKKKSSVNKNSTDKVDLGVINKRATKELANYLTKFKQEPCILHVACKSLEDAQTLYDKAKSAGWKKSGLVSFRRNVIELNSTERLEFPIIGGDKILVDNEFLKIIVKKTNQNLKKSWRKIERLGKLI